MGNFTPQFLKDLASKERYEKEYSLASIAMKSFPRLSNGLVTDAAKATEAILDAFERCTVGLKFWERLAIKETFHQLCKE